MLLYIKVGYFLAIKENDIQKSQTDTNVAQSGQNVITAADVSEITATIGKLTEEFNQTRKQVEEMSKFIQRGHEAGIMNDTTHSSVVVRHTGQINLSASIYSDRKLNPNGKTVESSMESVALSNRSKFSVNDIVINEHKLNPYLYELTDMKKISITQNNDLAVGNFCVMGTVLTKTWERNLKRYTLLRRPFKGPLFSHVLNIPEINKGLNVTDPLKIDEELVAKSPKGYQVNAVVSDSESLINKPGIDPNVGSIKRDTHIIISSTAKASGTGTSSTAPTATQSSTSTATVTANDKNSIHPTANDKNPPSGVAGIVFECTAYCPGIDIQMEGPGITAMGIVCEGKTINAHYMAVDPSIFPLGTVFYVQFSGDFSYLSGEYVAVDTGSAIVGNIVDLYVGMGTIPANKQFEEKFGRQNVIVYRTGKTLTKEQAEKWRNPM